jgi:FtsP/CotA-like multicopper oxidase with cupredoxin domain
MEIGKINGGKGGFNVWTINGQPYEQSEPIKIHQGRRYRLAFVNKSDDMHHLHRHNFEITTTPLKSNMCASHAPRSFVAPLLHSNARKHPLRAAIGGQ